MTAAQIAPTAHLPHVVATAGPWQTVDIPFAFGTAKTDLQVVGRADPGGAVNRLPLVAGRWAAAPGEIVLTHSFARLYHAHPGQTIRALGWPGAPTLTVVGEVLDINEGDVTNWNPQNAWVLPGQLATLAPPDTTPAYLMAYRLDHGDAATMRTVSDAITAAVPTQAVGGIRLYTTVKQIDTLTTTLLLVFLLAFAVFALGAMALIIANVVAGAVLASLRDVSVLKALGFTPAQVVWAFIGQMLLPACVGGLIGAPLGVLASRPILAQSADIFGAASLPLPISEPLLALGGALLVVALAAGVPALRAARLSPLTALRRSDSPALPHSRLGRVANALGLARPLSLGIDDAYARPLRGLLTTIAVLIGVTTLTFALGLHTSIHRIANDPLVAGPDVTVSRYGTYPDSAVMQTLAAQPDTLAVLANTYASTAVAGLLSPVLTMATRGDITSYGYHLLSGRWYNAPGEVVSGAAFAQEAHMQVGDTFTGSIGQHALRLKLVGTYFDTNNFGRILRMDWSDYLAANPTGTPDFYFVTLTPTTNTDAYVQRVAASAPDYLSVTPRASGSQSVFGIVDAVVVVLALVLGLVAVVGVFNTAFLTTRERLHDIAVLKALGMTPRQVVLMVSAAAALLGLVGGLLGVPAGVWLHGAILDLMGRSLNDPLPPVFGSNTYEPALFPVLALAGVAAALLGAWLPAWLASRQSVVATLQSE